MSAHRNVAFRERVAWHVAELAEDGWPAVRRALRFRFRSGVTVMLVLAFAGAAVLLARVGLPRGLFLSHQHVIVFIGGEPIGLDSCIYIGLTGRRSALPRRALDQAIVCDGE